MIVSFPLHQLDLPLSEAFYAWLLGEERCLTLKDLAHIDAMLAKSLSELISLVRRRELAEWDGSGETEALVTAVDDLALDFTLPGHGMELCKGGRDIPVTLENLQKYLQVSLVRSALSYVSTVVHPLEMITSSGCIGD